jgi:hypothetical protein
MVKCQKCPLFLNRVIQKYMCKDEKKIYSQLSPLHTHTHRWQQRILNHWVILRHIFFLIIENLFLPCKLSVIILRSQTQTIESSLYFWTKLLHGKYNGKLEPSYLRATNILYAHGKMSKIPFNCEPSCKRKKIFYRMYDRDRSQYRWHILRYEPSDFPLCQTGSKVHI